MLLTGNKFSSLIMQKLLLNIVFITGFAINVSAQNNNADSNLNRVTLSPLLLSVFKKPLQANPLLAEKIKPSKFELMYWPNYPLTAAQIAARDARANQSPGAKIASDIIDSYINSLLYGRKKSLVVATPIF